MKERISEVCTQLKKVADNALAEFGGFTPEQLNWKPSEKEWSVAQCFDHLIVTHSLYFSMFERFATGDTKMSFLEKTSPFSSFFGRFLIKGLDPKNLKKMKTTGKAAPSASGIGGDIIQRFCDHQQQMINSFKKLPSDLDLTKQIVTSPLLGVVTYSLDDAFTFVPMHCVRHFDQAKRVTEMAGFPK
ncbi:MAG: DinB family protein [Pyrinomonadaceae bacterium]